MPAHAARTCPHCSTVIPAGFPPDLCPRCLLAAQLPGTTAAPPISTTPGLDSLRPLFPGLEILDVLGSGGMGTVYKARQPRLNRIVALKVMTCESSHEKDFTLRFEREAQLLARLNHPNIVSIFDFGEIPSERTGGSPLFYFLMEHVEGTDLTRLIHSRELTPTQALAIVPQICDALQFAHEEGITHRDIKPANILIDKKGTVKIADFGLAKMARQDSEHLVSGLTQTGTAIGTPHYMAPEQWDDPESVDHRTDIYALGVVFYEMLTGERPMGRFDPPSRKSPVDRRIDEVVMRAMEREPDRRYQQASEIKTAVSNLAARHSGSPRKKTGRLQLTVVATLAVLLGGGIYLWKKHSPAANSPSAAAGHFPSGKWTPIDNLMRETPGIITDSEGWWRQEEGYHLKLGTFSARNAGIRCRIQGSTEKLPQPILRDHKHTPGNKGRTTGFAVMYVRNPELTAQFSRLDETLGMIDLGQFPPPPPVSGGGEYHLEFYAIGKTLIARIDGRTFTRTIDKEPPDLGTGAAFFNLASNRARDMELINLDGLDETEALRLAGAETLISPSSQ